MPKQIVLFGAGKSASYLIRYLLQGCQENNWRLLVADSNLTLAQEKLHNSSFATAAQVNIHDATQRGLLIKDSDLVISLLPPALHFIIANDCIQFGKHLLTASYLDEQMASLSSRVDNAGLLFLCEMGLDPGIDHMSALRLVHRIKEQGGKIISFKSHCGGLIAPESDDNPWHYKISWNPRNIVRAGSSGAVFKEDNSIKEVAYEQLFENCKPVENIGLTGLVYYPNRDSTEYMKVYDLEDAPTFIRTTLRHQEYCRAWNSIVNAGLTNDAAVANVPGLTFEKWSQNLQKICDESLQEKFRYLDVYARREIPVHLQTSADILQYLLEKKWMIQPHDKDMIIMLHEIEFLKDGVLYKTDSLLQVIGEDSVDTAMAKTVGLPWVLQPP